MAISSINLTSRLMSYLHMNERKNMPTSHNNLRASRFQFKLFSKLSCSSKQTFFQMDAVPFVLVVRSGSFRMDRKWMLMLMLWRIFVVVVWLVVVAIFLSLLYLFRYCYGLWCWLVGGVELSTGFIDSACFFVIEVQASVDCRWNRMSGSTDCAEAVVEVITAAKENAQSWSTFNLK